MTDLDKLRFVKEAFDAIKQLFVSSLQKLGQENENIDCEFTEISPTKFTCEVFVDGQSGAKCKICLGSMFSSGQEILYAEGHFDISQDTSYNEALSISQGSDELALSAMGMGFHGAPNDINLEQLSASDAAEYLWHRFASSLER